jgi:hypothetical protein
MNTGKYGYYHDVLDQTVEVMDEETFGWSGFSKFSKLA